MNQDRLVAIEKLDTSLYFMNDWKFSIIKMRVLLYLAQSQDMVSGAHISRALHASPPQICRILEDLRCAELVEITPSKKDKRVILSKLTGKGLRSVDILLCGSSE